jgi:hypothetical protein
MILMFTKTYWNISHIQNFNLGIGSLSIGDSWFWFPIGNLSRSIEPLLDDHQANLVIGNNGLATKNLHGVYHQISSVIQTYHKTIKYILVSIGGNDFFGGHLMKFLKQNSKYSSRYDQCIDIDLMKNHAEEVSHRVTKFCERLSVLVNSQTRIIIHGYDYPQASREGPSLFKLNSKISGPMDACQIPEPFRKDILTMVVDTYNLYLSNNVNQSIQYVDLRGTLDRDIPWFDEIHPTSTQFGSLALKIREKMEP